MPKAGVMLNGRVLGFSLPTPSPIPDSGNSWHVDNRNETKPYTMNKAGRPSSLGVYFFCKKGQMLRLGHSFCSSFGDKRWGLRFDRSSSSMTCLGRCFPSFVSVLALSLQANVWLA